MTKTIFISLHVSDLAASTAFDPDGHPWAALWMNPAAMQAAANT